MDKQRRRKRVKAVLPVRLVGTDSTGRNYCELAHTLDISDSGVRLGAIRTPLKVGSRLVLQYRQHKAEFRVIWIVQLKQLKEHQIGLEAVVQRDLWGLAAEPTLRLELTMPERAFSPAGA